MKKFITTLLLGSTLLTTAQAGLMESDRTNEDSRETKSTLEEVIKKALDQKSIVVKVANRETGEIEEKELALTVKIDGAIDNYYRHEIDFGAFEMQVKMSQLDGVEVGEFQIDSARFYNEFRNGYISGEHKGQEDFQVHLLGYLRKNISSLVKSYVKDEYSDSVQLIGIVLNEQKMKIISGSNFDVRYGGSISLGGVNKFSYNGGIGYTTEGGEFVLQNKRSHEVVGANSMSAEDYRYHQDNSEVELGYRPTKKAWSVGLYTETENVNNLQINGTMIDKELSKSETGLRLQVKF